MKEAGRFGGRSSGADPSWSIASQKKREGGRKGEREPDGERGGEEKGDEDQSVGSMDG